MDRLSEMKATEFRQPFPEDLSLNSAIYRNPPGVAVSVMQIPPYWDVCVRLKAGTSTVHEYFVTETPMDGSKPLRISDVFRTKTEALADAELTANLWVATHVFGPEWPWEWE